MNNNFIEINEKLTWNFARYNVLLPKQKETDVFEWLYLSLIVSNNESQNIPKLSYKKEIVEIVENILKMKFNSVITFEMLSLIKQSIENKFVRNDLLNESVIGFLDTYEDLFDESVEVKRVFIDCVTKEVLPYFGDMSILDDVKDKTFNQNDEIVQPSAAKIRRAYETYIKYNKQNVNHEEITENHFIDEDTQFFLDDEEDFDVIKESNKKETRTINGYNVIFVENGLAFYTLNIDMYKYNNALYFKSPFNDMTDAWFNKCVYKARNVNNEIDEYLSNVESKYLDVKQRAIDEVSFSSNTDLASQLGDCETLYRVIEGYNNKYLKNIVLDIYSNYSSKNEMYYLHSGKLLEGILNNINYITKTTHQVRINTNYGMFSFCLESKCSNKSIKYKQLIKESIHNDWTKKYKNPKKEYNSFKADVADIILRTDILDDEKMYDDFISDIFYIYDNRNTASHANEKSNLTVDKSSIEKLTKIVRILDELI